MLSRPHRRYLKYGTALGTAMAFCLLAAPVAHSQELAQEIAQAGPSAGGASQSGAGASSAGLASASDQASGQSGVSGFVGSLIPGSRFGARVDLSESYATNPSGFSTGARSDWITTASLGLTFNQHSARVSLDANYNGSVYFYAGDSQTTQFTNDLQALGTVIVIPDYVNFNARAFAQPIVTSNVGIVNAGGTYGSNGFRNSYGLSGGPDITFRLGNFANSVTSANIGAAYFTDPSGFTIPGIPGVAGPQNTTMRTFSQRFMSGTDFTRLNWTLAATMQEMERPQGLFSEKAAVGHFQFAITREISLLGTGGYDKISNTRPLSRDLSGPVGTGGIALTLGEDFFLEFEVGEKYQDISYQGSLRWNIGPTAVLTGSVTDTVTTPEGQLLDSLSSLTATSNGGLISSGALYANGTASALSSFNAQGYGSLSYNQNISRYQSVNLNYSQDFGRDHAMLAVYASKQTILDMFFFGPPETNSWGANATWSHDLTRLMTATLGGGYTRYQELGGHAGVYNVNAGLNYTLSPATTVYLRTDYLNRKSSSALQSLSPFTGSLDDLRVTIGIGHTL
jgi:uncharacterized protein (PEP-CTERM system associated)